MRTIISVLLHFIPHLLMHLLRTYFPDANETVRLEYGEFLIHPGNLVHAGMDITKGTRYLMVIFTHIESS